MTFQKSLNILIAAIVTIVAIGLVLPSLTRCVAEGTLVDTPTGPRPVETLRARDPVLSVTPEGRVVEATVVGIRRSVTTQWRRLSLDRNRSLELTGTHPIGVPAGWRQAAELRPGDELRTADGLLRLLSTEARFGLLAVYDLSVEPHGNFIAAGVLLHNKSIRMFESEAIRDLRSLGNAQHAYASSNGGFFGQPTCLVSPTGCGWPAGTGPFIDFQPLSTRAGYTRSFIAGPIGKGKVEPGLETFVYVTTPTPEAAWVKGPYFWSASSRRRAFAMDHTGLICMTQDGSIRPLANAALSPSCAPLK